MFANKQTLFALALASPALAMKSQGRATRSNSVPGLGKVSQDMWKEKIKSNQRPLTDLLQTSGPNGIQTDGLPFDPRDVSEAHMQPSRGPPNPQVGGYYSAPDVPNQQMQFKSALRNQKNKASNRPIRRVSFKPEPIIHVLPKPHSEEPRIMKFLTSKTVWGLGLAGVAGVYSGLDLAAVGPDHAGSNVFTGHNIEIGNFTDGGWIAAIAMTAGVSLGLMFLVMSLTPKEQHGMCFYHFMYLSTLLGSASLMLGLNFIQTNASDLGTAIIGGLKNIDVQAVDATHVVEHNHGLAAQFLLIGGSILFGIMLLCLVYSQGKRFVSWWPWCKNQ